MEKWEGGFVRVSKSGKKTYYILRRIKGRKYELSTRASTLRAAMKELGACCPNAFRARSAGISS